MKRLLLVLLVSILFLIPAYGQGKRADLAGKWYSESKELLHAELNSYLEKATPPPIDGEVLAIISPHAGFVYSGPVAAYGFKAISAQRIKTVVIVGFSHRRYYDGIAVLDQDGFETPLGFVKINRKLTEELTRKNPKIYDYPLAFLEENSVEMEIPFLQMALGGDFEIVLIAIGEQSFKNCVILGEALYEVLRDKNEFLLVASTDMSHYLLYERANQIDNKTISLIQELDPNNLYAQSMSSDHQLMCGYGAVCATMIASKMLGANKVEILKYTNSGDTAGDKNRVVGYLSAAIVKAKSKNPAEALASSGRQKSKTVEASMLNEEERKKMLKLARDSIIYYLKEKKRLSVKEDGPRLNQEMGAFVTLHKEGRLRGCIGNLEGRGPFYLTVRNMAIEAATVDPRFRPVTLDEMGDIDIEISALSPMEKIDDPEKIEMGKHGVVVRKGFMGGVYLPQVATETGWNREQFMNSLCADKAGMDPDAWKKGECDIYIFTAEVFGEKD